MAVLNYNPLLNIGDPVTAALLAQAEGAVVSPFSNQLTTTGLVPMSDIPAQPTAPVVKTPAAEPLLPPAAPSSQQGVSSSESPATSGDYEAEPLDVAGFRSGWDPNNMPHGFSPFSEFSPSKYRPGTPEEIAEQYATSILGAQPKGAAIGDIFSQPFSRTLGQHFERQESIPSFLLGAVPGGGFVASGLLGAISDANMNQLANDYAKSQMGIPGYSVGMYGGQPFSISPGLFGSRALSGTLPPGITVSDIERMGQLAQGINPYGGGGGGLNFLGGSMRGTGIGGYTQSGNYVDEHGNISAMGTWSAMEDLAEAWGVTVNDAQDALASARSGESNLESALSDAPVAAPQPLPAAPQVSEDGSVGGSLDGSEDWGGAYDSGADGYL